MILKRRVFKRKPTFVDTSGCVLTQSGFGFDSCDNPVASGNKGASPTVYTSVPSSGVIVLLATCAETREKKRRRHERAQLMRTTKADNVRGIDGNVSDNGTRKYALDFGCISTGLNKNK